jgi:ankyrin repeat protein
VDAQDAVGNSALIRACTVADYGCLCMLLKGGADVNARTVDGGTALLRACKHARVFSREHAERKVEVVSRLLEHKADVHARDHAGWTPVLHACEKGMRGLIKHLASEGADVNACVKDTGTAPIHMTAKAGHTDCVSVLIAHKAKVDAVDKQGRTALLHACANVNPLTVGMLLQHRANINAVAYNGDTGPLLLCKIGTRKALKLLHKMLHKTHTKGAPLAMVGPKTEEALLVYAVDLIQREKRQKEAVAHKIVAAIQGRQAIAAEDATTPNRPGIEAGEVDEAVVTTSVFSAAAVTVHVHDNELHQQSDIIPDTKCPQDDGIVITGQLDLSNGIALLNHLQPFLPRD